MNTGGNINILNDDNTFDDFDEIPSGILSGINFDDCDITGGDFQQSIASQFSEPTPASTLNQENFYATIPDNISNINSGVLKLQHQAFQRLITTVEKLSKRTAHLEEVVDTLRVHNRSIKYQLRYVFRGAGVSGSILRRLKTFEQEKQKKKNQSTKKEGPKYTHRIRLFHKQSPETKFSVKDLQLKLDPNFNKRNALRRPGVDLSTLTTEEKLILQEDGVAPTTIGGIVANLESIGVVKRDRSKGRPYTSQYIKKPSLPESTSALVLEPQTVEVVNVANQFDDDPDSDEWISALLADN